MASQPNPNAPQTAGHQALTGAGCDPSHAQQMTAAGLNDQQCQDVAALAQRATSVGMAFNWGGLIQLISTFGPQVIPLILGLFGKGGAGVPASAPARP